MALAFLLLRGRVKPGRTALTLPSMSTEEKEKVFGDWRDGKEKWVIGTCAFGEGIDYGHVRNVIMVESPGSMVEFLQQAGRAGRNGHKGAVKTFYLNTGDISHIGSGEDNEGHFEMHQLLGSKRICRRHWMSQFADGEGVTCISIPLGQMCDNCISVLVSRFIKDVVVDKETKINLGGRTVLS